MSRLPSRPRVRRSRLLRGNTVHTSHGIYSIVGYCNAEHDSYTSARTLLSKINCWDVRNGGAQPGTTKRVQSSSWPFKLDI